MPLEEPPADVDGVEAPTTALVSAPPPTAAAAAAAAMTTTLGTTTTTTAPTHTGSTTDENETTTTATTKIPPPFQFTSTLEDLLSTALTKKAHLDNSKKKTNTYNLDDTNIEEGIGRSPSSENSKKAIACNLDANNNNSNNNNNKGIGLSPSSSSQPNSNSNSNVLTCCPLFRLLPADIANRDIFLRYLKPSQRLPLFTIPELCRNFHLHDNFCPKHGVVYLTHRQVRRHGSIAGDDDINEVEDSSPYDMILPSSHTDPEQDVDDDDDGEVSSDSDDESGEGDDDDRHNRVFGRDVMSKVLKDIENDGKDVNVFLSKLFNRTVEFHIERWEDNTSNLPEVPLGDDQVYGQYFRRLKKCQSCEVEARTRYNAKRGILLCYHCEEPSPLDRFIFCDECNHNHGCNECDPEGVYFCERCDSAFCWFDCSEHAWCEQCDKNACKNCTRDGEFLVCSVCDEEVCEDCDVYMCEDCNEAYHYECRGGGYRTCCDKFRCSKCAAYSFCGGCHDSFCDECVDVSGYCCGCDEFICVSCVGMQVCAKCGDVECHRCIDSAFVALCRDCVKTFCEDCSLNPRFSELAHCSQCEDNFCIESCRDIMTCDDCESRACTKCTVTCDNCCYTSCLKCMGKTKEDCKNCSFCSNPLKQSTDDTSKKK